MSFHVEPQIWDDFPGMLLVVAYGKSLDNSFDRPQLQESLRATAARLKTEWSYPNAQSHPYVAAWRQALKRVGISPANYPCAIESLCRQAISGREIHNINPMVNFYNYQSLSHISPVGGWDVGGGRSITLRRTKGGEAFTELGKADTVFVNPGEVSYAYGREILTRHFVWRQSECAKITNQTTDFFLVSEVLPELGLEVAHQMQRDLTEGVQRYFSISLTSAILDATQTEWLFGSSNQATEEAFHAQ